MGLDISYSSKVTENLGHIDDSHYYTCNDKCFLYQLGDLKPKAGYIETSNSEYGGFCAGGYSVYNNWREHLSIMAGYGSPDNVWEDFNSNLRYMKLKKIETGVSCMKPFYELINFSDCEGIIATTICKKLYNDFADFNGKAELYSIDIKSGYFYEKYMEWTEAFRVASDGGVVSFH